MLMQRTHFPPEDFASMALHSGANSLPWALREARWSRASVMRIFILIWNRLQQAQLSSLHRIAAAVGSGRCTQGCLAL